MKPAVGALIETAVLTTAVVLGGRLHPAGALWAMAALPCLSLLARGGRFDEDGIAGRFDLRRSISTVLRVGGVALLAAAAWRAAVPGPAWRAPSEAATAGFWAAVLAEEWFFRGYVQGRLRPFDAARRSFMGTPIGASIVVSSVLFAAAHAGRTGLLVALLYVVPGLLLGYARARSGSLAAPIVLHALFNAWGAATT